MNLQLSHIETEEQLQEGVQASVQQDLDIRRDVELLEQKLCEYTGIAHCVSVESATTGLLLALKTVGVGSGDLVLCTSFSYFALTEIIQLAGAEPMLVDINPNTFNIDPYCLEYVITKCIRNRQPVPKALIAVDLFGLPCNYEALEEICSKYGIHLIEDMAQSFGATVSERYAGSFGRMAVASFFSSKPVDEMGEGGAIFCHTPQDAHRLQSLRKKVYLTGNTQAANRTGSYLNSIQASIVYKKLETFDKELESRRICAAHYRERLQDTVKVQSIGSGYQSAFTQFVIALNDEDMRDYVAEFLRGARIPCQIYEPSPLPCREEQKDWGKVTLLNAKAVSRKILALPIHPYLNRRVVDYMCDKILEAVDLYHSEPILSQIAEG